MFTLLLLFCKAFFLHISHIYVQTAFLATKVDIFIDSSGSDAFSLERTHVHVQLY